MTVIKIKKGLNVPISGAPQQTIDGTPEIKSVAIIGEDYVGMKPTMLVKVGDKVKKGQVVFTDKKMPKVKYTSPGAGEVIAINRGNKRVFQSLVVRLEGDEEQTFKAFSESNIKSLQYEKVRDVLLDSGQWPAIRTRPYSKVADPETRPQALFVNAMDTNPLAASPEVIINENKQDFINGLTIVSKLTTGKTHLCVAQGSDIPGSDLGSVKTSEFTGVHPAGNVGTHIHFLDPAGPKKLVWYIGYQDVIAIGKLFTTGKVYVDRVVSIAGPAVNKPRLVRVRVGACLDDVLNNETQGEDLRVISGSILSGRTAGEPFNFLGRFHNQVSVLKEGREREFLGWQSPGFNKFSLKNIFASKLMPGKKFAMTTSTNGSLRSMVPIGSYESVMPLDVLPTLLLRALLSGDTDRAQELGCLELDEEDLSLCTFVCPCKINYGPVLRDNLAKIEKDG